MKTIFFILLAYLAYRAVKSWVVRALQVNHQGPASSAKIDDVMIKDPVCGIYFPRREGVELRHKGQVVSFCSEACRDQFKDANR